MNPIVLSLLAFLAISLLIATVLFVVRDLVSPRGADESDLIPIRLDPRSLMAEQAAGYEVNESWLARLATETGTGFTEETALLLAIAVGLAIGGVLFLWRNDWLVSISGAALGVFAVGGLLFYLRARRQRAIREQLPDVMEMIARAVRAGESLDQAIALAGNSSLPPLGTEFRHCASQMEKGLSLEGAIRGLVRRAPLPESRVLAMTLIVQRQKGGNLPTALERLARVIRDRLAYYRQFRAATSARRGAATLIAVIAVALDVAVLVFQPEYTQSLLNTSPGRIMLGLSLILQAVGVIWAMWLFRSGY